MTVSKACIMSGDILVSGCASPSMLFGAISDLLIELYIDLL